MALANLIAYAVVFGLPIWLVAEELIHRFAPRRKVEAAAPALAATPTAAPADRKRRAPEGARARASFV
jgi:hypothetical protein